MCPDPALGATKRGLPWNGESAALLPATGCGQNKHHRAIAFAVTVQVAIRISHGPAAKFGGFPHDLARLEVLADPSAPRIVRPAVQVVAEQHDASMLVLHQLVLVNLFGLD